MEIETDIEIETETGEPPTEIQQRFATYVMLIHGLVKFFKEHYDMDADAAVEIISKAVRVVWDEE